MVILTHEEHAQVKIPQGNWEIRIQHESKPKGWRHNSWRDVTD